jgi:hypothetical protein
MSRKPIERGNLVRKTVDRRDYYGTAFTSESHRGRLKVRVEWFPDHGTWEEPSDLTVISVLQMEAA